MGRAKIMCQGRTQDGMPCKNWAIKGSFYCSLHQGQTNEKDRQAMNNANVWTWIIMIAIILIGFIISSAAGCQKEFIKWLGK